MKKPLRKLIAFSTAMAAMMSGTILNSAAVYVAEKVEGDYDTLIQMRDKEFLIQNGNAESIDEDTQLIMIDENGEKQLIDKNLGINGIYSYVSTTMGQYNYISPTNPAYSFDFFDESYRISTEANEFIVGVGDKFALMDNEQNIISDVYNNIYRINEEYFIIDDSTDSTYSYSDENRGFEDNKSGLMKADGTVIVPPTDGVIGYYLTADGENFLVRCENYDDYFIDLNGNAVTETYKNIDEFLRHNDSYSVYPHVDVDKYRANYLLCEGGFLANNENGRYVVINSNLEVLHEDANYVYDLRNHYYVMDDGIRYEYDKDFNLISQIQIPETLNDDAYQIYDNNYNLIAYVNDYNGAVTLWNAKDFNSKTIEISIPEEAELEGFSFDDHRGASQCNLIVDVYYYLDGEYTWESHYYMVAPDLQFIEVTGLYSVDWFEYGKTIKYVDPETNSLNIIDMSGNVIFSAPEGFDYLTKKTHWDYNEETGRYNDVLDAYILLSDSAFYVYDTDWNPIWENIPGQWRYSSYYSVTDEGDKYGVFTLEDGVIIEPQFGTEVMQRGDRYFAVKDERLYAMDLKGNVINSWNDTYEYDTTTHSSYDTIEGLGDKYFAILDGNTVILDSDMNVLQEWSGVYQFDGGTYSAYTVDHTLNKRENGVTSTVVYNSETDKIDYQQEGLYDHVSYCLAGYMIVTNYGDSDDLWSGNNKQGIIKLDGTEVITPTDNLTIGMFVDADLRFGGYRIVTEDEIGFRLDGSGDTNYDSYNWRYYLKPSEIEYEFAHENGYVFAYKTEAGTYVTAKEIVDSYHYMLFGMADKDGNVLAENEYRYPFEFIDGLALITEYEPVPYVEKAHYDYDNDSVYTSTKKGIIDCYGRMIVKPFENQILAHKIDPYADYWRVKESVVICGDNIYGGDEKLFHVARLQKDGTYELTDYRGKDVVNDFALSNGYDVAKAEGDFYYVEKDGLSGIVSSSNEVLVPVQYAAVLSFNACAHTFKYVREQLKGVLADEFTSKLKKLSDGSLLVNVKDTNGKIGVYKIYDDGNEPSATTTTTTITTAVDVPVTTTTTSTTVPDTPDKTYTMGDINSDGTIDAMDASLVLIEYSNMATQKPGIFVSAQREAADVNKDGNVDALDASNILIYYSDVATGKTPTWR